MNTVINRKKLILVLSWAIVLLWMLLIFYSSAQVADQSNKLSKGITEVIVETVEKVAPEATFDLDTFNHFVRKNAHFFAYLLLGIFVLHALWRSGVGGVRALVIAFGICVLYAISDEVHQLFVPGRGGQAKDVLIDSSGAIVGIGIYRILKKKKRAVTPQRV